MTKSELFSSIGGLVSYLGIGLNFIAVVPMSDISAVKGHFSDRNSCLFFISFNEFVCALHSTPVALLVFLLFEPFTVRPHVLY